MISFGLLLTVAVLAACLSGAVCILLCLRVHSLEKWRERITDVACEGLDRV